MAQGRWSWLCGAMLVGTSLSLQAAELRVGIVSDALTLDPHNYRDRTTQSILGNLYDGPFLRLGADPEPALFQDFRQIDRVTYEATIRPGVRFHSGDPLTAEDVKFSLERLTVDNAIGGQTSPRKSLIGPLKSVELVAADRLRLNLSAPWPILPLSLTPESVVNRRFVEQAGPAGLATRVDGAGPFKLVAWNRGDSIVMERFAGYYGGPPSIPPAGPARVDRVVFRVIPEPTSRVAALQAGEIEIAAEVPVHLRSQVQRGNRAKVMQVNGTSTFFVALNVTRPPFDDLRVRQAANHAINRKLIIDRVLSGTATPVNGVLSPDSFGFHPSLPDYAFDQARAKRLLAEAGHAAGVEATLDTIGANKDIAEALAQMLTEVGIRTRVQVWEGAVLYPLWQDPSKKERQMLLRSWGSGALEPNGIFVPTLMTRERGNASGYSNAEVDRLLDAARSEPDDGKRSRLWQDAQAIVNREAPWIFLWVPQDIYGVANSVRDWQPHPSAMIYLHRATLAR